MGSRLVLLGWENESGKFLFFARCPLCDTNKRRLATINALPPNLIYKSASKTAMELAPCLREQGADMVIAVTHQREPNDDKLAQSIPPGTVDIILGGHDHYYAHSIVNSTHVLRSGTDFKQLSYIEAFRKPNGQQGWDFNIVRRDMVCSIPEDPATVALVGKLTSSLKAKLEKPVGYSSRPLDGRFTTVRLRESNLGNFVCDLMRFYYNADCAIMAGGTIRGDQIYPPGILRLKDILNCFPFEDPVVLLRITGKMIWDALENGVSLVPALEGRFPQVSNISFGFNPSRPSGSRVTWAKLGGKPLDLEKLYVLATRGYMGRGKDGFSSLLVRSEGGEAEEIVSEENGVMISTILRQYFLSLKVLGTWVRWSPSLKDHWSRVHNNLHAAGYLRPPAAGSSPGIEKKTPVVPVPTKVCTTGSRRPSLQRSSRKQYYYGRFPEVGDLAGTHHNHDDDDYDHAHDTMDSDSDEDPDILTSPLPTTNYVTFPATSAAEEERRLRLARWATRKWKKAAGLRIQPGELVADDCITTTTGDVDEFTPSWTPGIAPRLEGRIVVEGADGVTP